ncbi:hypothetical protein [Streptomyces montanisoli]|uniref:Uncharacterized protein n=1 Tax=Streptomyces montanisoli TaxID=2798581 RepID=A0A940RVR6_9ACTN|nr:hypothetical protein [Streptomyces montanisoli]MBP0459337.1 hypothetical protein [Streptomyces montanisoli]
MDTTRPTAAPIYDRLIAERGDVVADAAHVAEQTSREAAGTLDFGLPDDDGDGGRDTDRDGAGTGDGDGDGA